MLSRLALSAAIVSLVAAASPAGAQTRITLGQEIASNLSDADSRLADGSLYECYVLEPGSGPVTIDLKTAYFDAFLAVGTGTNCGDGMRVLATDDDGGTNTNARVVQTFTAPRILIRANAFGAGESGNFWLSVTAGAPQEEARQGSLNALPQGVTDWGSDAETCTGAYLAMNDARDSLTQYGNVGAIDYTARARQALGRGRVDQSMAEFIGSNFVLIALGGIIDDKPQQVAEYLETVAGCDRALGFSPVTRYR